MSTTAPLLIQYTHNTRDDQEREDERPPLHRQPPPLPLRPPLPTDGPPPALRPTTRSATARIDASMDGGTVRAHVRPYNGPQRFVRPDFSTSVPPPSQTTTVPVPPPCIPGRAQRLQSNGKQSKVHLSTKPPPPSEQAPAEQRLTSENLRKGGNEYVVDPCHKSQKSLTHTKLLHSQSIVCTQPRRTEFSKTLPSVDQLSCPKSSGTLINQESIYCPKCKKCVCNACATQKELPEAWICDKTVRCSASECVNKLSCMCAVNCMFYHIFPDPDGVLNDYDDPCSCEPSHCCQRWTIMAAILPCLPCLLCYWPLRGCVAMCTGCYNCTRRTDGCRCKKRVNGHKLLIESENSSV